ncbi:hypothetical protein V7794_05040 [Rhizobium laguerreae]
MLRFKTARVWRALLLECSRGRRHGFRAGARGTASFAEANDDAQKLGKTLCAVLDNVAVKKS